MMVRVLAVSKGQDFAKIYQAFLAGQHAFGENYWQEAWLKIQRANALGLSALEWHFIGHIQSNKVKQIAQHVDWVQTVDSVALIKRLNQYRASTAKPLNICLQVNITGERQKSGVKLEHLDVLVEAALACPRLCLRGLMAIGLAEQAEDERYAEYTRLAQVYRQLAVRISSIDTLSLGMSQDKDIAIAAGSTMIRIGTAFFGERGKK